MNEGLLQCRLFRGCMLFCGPDAASRWSEAAAGAAASFVLFFVDGARCLESILADAAVESDDVAAFSGALLLLPPIFFALCRLLALSSFLERRGDLPLALRPPPPPPPLCGASVPLAAAPAPLCDNGGCACR